MNAARFLRLPGLANETDAAGNGVVARDAPLRFQALQVVLHMAGRRDARHVAQVPPRRPEAMRADVAADSLEHEGARAGPVIALSHAVPPSAGRCSARRT